MERSDLVGAGRHNDDSSLLRSIYRLQQQMGQQKVTQMVHAEVLLEAVFGQLPSDRDHAGVVDQNIQHRIFRLEFRREAADACKRAQIAEHKLKLPAAAPPLCLLEGGFTALAAPAGHHNPDSPSGELYGCGKSHTGAGSGNDSDLFVHVAPPFLPSYTKQAGWGNRHNLWKGSESGPLSRT
ncbi:hypothetical protein D3C71_1462990 [compost metagenome]